MNYRDWFTQNWYKKKGLLSPATAGKIVGITGARITQIWREKKLELFQYNEKDKPLIGWQDFLDFKTERESKDNEQ